MFSTDNAATTNDTFCKWALSKDMKRTTYITHYSKSYVTYFIIQYILKHMPTVKYKTIRNGTKIMILKIKEGGLNIKFIDSHNFIHSKLSDFPKTSKKRILSTFFQYSITSKLYRTFTKQIVLRLKKYFESNWYGFIECKIFPLTKLYHPVLPIKSKKIVFTLFNQYHLVSIPWKNDYQTVNDYILVVKKCSGNRFGYRKYKRKSFKDRVQWYMLDEWTDELGPSVHIIDWVSTSPKSIAHTDNENRTKTKINGFTLSYENVQKLNLDSMKKIMNDEIREVELQFQQITREILKLRNLSTTTQKIEKSGSGER
ncbi:hypothetical protein AGLY_001761 [Aphis glycines]|uniref:Uncharacterized protein n=1 Tax=Aphis glycines TaxID=307491 RepID=A0A6G0U713_APHGL|nr:hypothetical protein AGLY_001761 [Aphis glycines]